ncbi:hypothetical protein CC79DRAFT_1391828 [Sarocladium strictum]
MFSAQPLSTGETTPQSASYPAPKPVAGNKRKGSRTQAAAYPRKRAVAACETCRIRKTKCDNKRPRCSACVDLEIECVFRDSKTEYSNYDPASLEILQRINYVATLLESQSHHSEPQGSTSSATSSRLNPLSTPPPQPDLPARPKPCTEPDVENVLESLEIAGRTPGVCEDILEWPVFKGRRTSYDRARIESLIFRTSPGTSDSTASFRHGGNGNGSSIFMGTPGRGVNEEDAPSHAERFLVNVHIKNPVLNPSDLRRNARWVAENGFGWDADSCLMLIVCALSTISSDFTAEPVTPDLVQGPNAIRSLTDTHDYGTAEAYFLAARKRLGLLDYTISAAQCFFLSGVYEMYTLRPLKAWGAFSRACEVLQIYFRGQNNDEAYASEGMVSRLYWSCLKSECEIRMEINLPPSGLAKVAYSDVFPSPPSDHQISHVFNNLASPSSDTSHPEVERIWSYYLSEIAVRKIGNRIMNCFYQEDAAAWLSMPLHRLTRIAEELELQLSQWFENIPVILFTPSTPSPSDPPLLIAQELQFVLHARLSDFRERIYRPFLYLAIHLPPNDPAQDVLAPYVSRCVDACLSFLQRGTPRHRHHGTWYENRGMFLKTLLLVAGKRSGAVRLPEGWREGAGACLAGFRFWEGEAPDLREAREVLTELLDDV